MKLYRCYCHGCGKLHDVWAYFLSSPLSKEVDGVAYPVRGCEECIAVPGRIAAAYKRMTEGKNETL